MGPTAPVIDAGLSKYDPLGRILCFDRFDSTTHGWTELIGNYNGRGDLGTVDEHMRDFRPPQLSSCSFFDVGTHGTLSGNYALKLATRAHRGHTATGIRRLTMAGRGLVRIEAYFAFKAEATVGRELPASVAWDGNRHPSEAQFGAFTVATDICADNGVRYHNVIRYQNTNLAGEMTQQWMYPVVPEPTPRDHQEGKFALPYAADFTAPDPDDWRYFDEPLELCVNEVPTKINWHYLRWDIDTRTRSNVELRLNDRVMDMRDVPVPVYPDRYSTLDNLLNFYFSVRTHADIRNFLFLDSVLISVDW
ncbi:DUF6772 family protein [Streptosporangium pseudovulgare]|uniref:GH16 domain-containing protein n=1 Tax=Streptosporangium pseudovulgare TaxID=35765 RepID=A0ABQ2RJC9_9ACTN|nr:DUF6772 family protein [Streptosporangium pseudovulgare]GGQ35322.1 hypothetical protein GCM10010140_76670 [Streptosporangium pseudovulgare]